MSTYCWVSEEGVQLSMEDEARQQIGVLRFWRQKSPSGEDLRHIRQNQYHRSSILRSPILSNTLLLRRAKKGRVDVGLLASPAWMKGRFRGPRSCGPESQYGTLILLALKYIGGGCDRQDCGS